MQELIEAALKELGDGPDEVAENLRAAGATTFYDSSHCDGGNCPVWRYLADRFPEVKPGLWVSMVDVRTFDSSKKITFTKLPMAVQSFIGRFDFGGYYDFLRTPEEPS